jgi:transcription-repair coupling factor (superfamily II helicase)
VDIVIGTHKLLQADVSFRQLGLVIVDEEHRFGVSHKERLKKMRAEIDILTLTATPIPRTLQMSLLSIRDLSVISTPPEHRLPVKTFVARFDELVIKEAVSRELRRGGQVFVVHNRVRSIHGMAAQIENLVPDAKVAVAHGQMGGKELEDIMVSFVNRDINVLVATTIIESGLDIPSANTIIINRADSLGLAEIYQLRGRVGRSATQSFAYLLVPSVDHLSKDSRERLRALMDCSELGGGFKLAMSDLQIRGGGNLLGVSQSGNIAAIGYDLYLDLLQKTVADLKARAAKGDDVVNREELDPEVNLQLSSFIPQDYIPDISQRYLFYRRISALVGAEREEQTDLEEELIDRYGPLPDETITLFAIIEIKKKLARLGITRLEQGKNSLVFSFVESPPLTPEMLLKFLGSYQAPRGREPKFTPDGRLVIYQELANSGEIFALIETILNEFETLAGSIS